MSKKRWFGIALLFGVLYTAVGVITGEIAGAAATTQMRNLWRWSAFVISGMLFAAHIAHEHVRLRSTTRTAAWHTAIGVALGGFGLALAANIHELAAATSYRPKMVIALIAWPLITAVPAYIAALAIAAGLGAMRTRGQPL